MPTHRLARGWLTAAATECQGRGMKALVVYESMYGNTHAVAQAIGKWVERRLRRRRAPVEDAPPAGLADAEVLVVGGPTHVHGMSRPSSRKAAAEAARKPGSGLVLDEGAEGPGVREWLDVVGAVPAHTAAFDTRISGPAVLMGQASHGISRVLRRHGGQEVVPPESFLVTKDNRLLDGELERARQWGALLAASVSTSCRAS